MTSYTQCELKKDDRVMVKWMPSETVCLGAVLRIRGEGGWVVTQTWDMQPSPPDYRKDIRGHVKQTGDGKQAEDR